MLTIHPEDKVPVKNVTIRRIPRQFSHQKFLSHQNPSFLICFICNFYISLHLTSSTYSRVPETLPLYDILNEFQKGHSHMAVVVRQCVKAESYAVNESPTNSKIWTAENCFHMFC